MNIKQGRALADLHSVVADSAAAGLVCGLVVFWEN